LKRKTERKLYSIAAAGLIVSLLSGCAMFESAIPELTESEQDVVVEYAAETLLRYDTKGGGRIKHVNQELTRKPEIVDDGTAAEDTSQAPEEAEPTPVPESMTVVDNPDAVEDPEIIDNTGAGESSFSTIEAALGLQDVVRITYQGYEVTDYYPEDIGNYFVMNAQEGYELLVLRFRVENTTGSDLSLAMPYAGTRYKITLNGETKNALSTLLLDDLAAYSGTIPTGGYEDLVLVAEYTPEALSSISSLSLSVKAENGSANINLG